MLVYDFCQVDIWGVFDYNPNRFERRGRDGLSQLRRV